MRDASSSSIRITAPLSYANLTAHSPLSNRPSIHRSPRVEHVDCEIAVHSLLFLTNRICQFSLTRNGFELKLNFYFMFLLWTHFKSESAATYILIFIYVGKSMNHHDLSILNFCSFFLVTDEPTLYYCIVAWNYYTKRIKSDFLHLRVVLTFDPSFNTCVVIDFDGQINAL